MTQNSKITRLNHVALAVYDIDNALNFWQDTLGLSLERVEHVPSQNAQVAFLPVGDSEIELVQPTSAETGLAKYLAKRGPGMHHIALEVDDLDAIEHKSDLSQITLRAELYKLEASLPPVDVMFLYKVISWIGKIADISEKIGSRLLILLAR